MIYNNVLELIGNTPLVRYNENISLKFEFYNPSNSVKDRAAYYMLKTAMDKGLVDKETLIIEPTSGNTGIGLAMCCAVLGLQLIIVMPENMSKERKKVICAYGAKLVLTPANEGMNGAVIKANQIAQEVKNSYIPMQFSNSANPLAHEQTTAKEIFKDTEGKVDIVVAGIGTGGTAVGLSNGLKKLNPNIKVFGVEPTESPLLSQGYADMHKIQGIGANFIPEILNGNKLDGILTVKGNDAIYCARELAKTHGILCGISSGANLKAALELSLRPEYKNKNIVTIMCDFGERYLSTELFEEKNC